jgi:hypothetical protein
MGGEVPLEGMETAGLASSVSSKEVHGGRPISIIPNKKHVPFC